jgi:pimeloyl-ACP methyl ester carboxylesterase
LFDIPCDAEPKEIIMSAVFRTRPWNRSNRALVLPPGSYASAANDEKISKAAWKGKPSWLICGENDQMLLKELERESATKMGAKTLVLPSSHVPMLSHPAEVANFIETAVREMGEASSQKAGHNTGERGWPVH